MKQINMEVSSALNRTYAHSPAHRAGELLSNIESQTAPATACDDGLGLPSEALLQLRHIGCFDARATVMHTDAHELTATAQMHTDLGFGRCMTQGVIEQVEEYAMQQFLVPHYELRALAKLKLESLVVDFGKWRYFVGDFFADLADIDGLKIQRQTELLLIESIARGETLDKAHGTVGG